MNNNKLVLFQVRRHVGEIDWLLPILFLLKKKGFKIITYFDDENIYKSLSDNKNLFNKWKSINTDFFIQKKVEKLFYKILLKFFIYMNSATKNFFSNYFRIILDKIKSKVYDTEKIFKKYTANNFKLFFLSENNHSNLYLKFNEKSEIKTIRFPTTQYIEYIPADRRIRRKNTRNTTILFADLHLFVSKQESETYFGNMIKKYTKKIIYCGNLKYNKWWTNQLYNNIQIKNSKKIKIIVATRCWEANFSKKSFKYIIDSIMKLTYQFQNIFIIFKVHPSNKEKIFLKEILSKYVKSKWTITKNHIIPASFNCDIGISLNTSACMDIVSNQVPCIEMWLNDVDNLNMIKSKNNNQTNFQKLGIVKNVNSYKQLLNQIGILQIKKKHYKIKKKQYSAFMKINKTRKSPIKIINQIL